MKNCSACGLSKPVDEFWMNSCALDGRRTECSGCSKARAKEKRLTGAPKAYASAWRAANPERERTYQTTYRVKHRERLAARNRARYFVNRDKERTRMLSWQRLNRAKSNAINMRYYAAKRRAVPKWANLFFIEEAYDLALRRTKATGFKWNVDHIVPLQSKVVCGLHVESNLRVIPAVSNRSKGNRHWPDMPESRKAA